MKPLEILRTDQGCAINQFYTYIHTKPNTQDVFYVGKGSKNRAWDFVRRNQKWKNIFNKHGVKVIICAHWDTNEEALEHEAFLVSCMKDLGFDLANLADGGAGPIGYKFTEEQRKAHSLALTGRTQSEQTKKKISEAQKGKPRRKWSEEEKQKASIARKGKKGRIPSEATRQKLSKNNGSKRPEVRAKISKTLQGRKPSDYVFQKLSLAVKGKPKSEEHKEKIRVALLAYFEKQRQLFGVAQKISDEHKKALRNGYNKHFGIRNENNQ